MSDKKTVFEIGKGEPGFETFAKAYRRQGTTDEAIASYAKYVGTVRNLSTKPLLKLSVEELEDLDEKLLAKSKVYRTVLKMFYRGNKRPELVEALPRQRRPKDRRLGTDEILMPQDVMALIEHAGSLRDRAIIATFAGSGGRCNEVLRLRIGDVKAVNGGFQLWFGDTKVQSQERHSPKIVEPWKPYIDAWLNAHPFRHDTGAWLFPSTGGNGSHVNDGTVQDMLRGVAKKAGISKRVNPHSFRHARVSWGVMSKEDTKTLCIGIWGVPFTVQLNRYTHFSNLEGADLETPVARDLPPVPALPIPPALSTPAQVRELAARVELLQDVLRQIVESIPKQVKDEVDAMTPEQVAALEKTATERFGFKFKKR